MTTENGAESNLGAGTAGTPSEPGPSPIPASPGPKESAEGAPNFIVGIGASAGGLEALERFLRAMPSNSGMAFVVIQHLSPDFKSLMDELLARHTSMKIIRVMEPANVQRDTVYLLPPRKDMVMAGGKLFTRDRPTDQHLSMPINLFFRSLAREAKDKAVAIVLSGTGTDGSAGLLDVHDMGGLVLVQSETTAKFDGMPLSAIDTGLADAVLAPEEMPETLLAYARNPSLPLLERKRRQPGPDGLVGLPAIIEKLREVYGIDFNYYKPATISRRIDRRIALANYTSFQEYSQRVTTDSGELDALYRDLLIGVTRFFRDPEAFQTLRTEVIPSVLHAVAPEEEVRIWVPACATGEEPYSLAILLSECMQEYQCQRSVKIFATDVHRDSLHIASEGLYSESSLEELSLERRMRFFEPENKMFRVRAELRKMLIFSPHNLIKDPPFTRMDLVSCRNLLIYFQSVAQTKALSAFHFALKLRGVLLLGPSEGPGELEEEFECVDRQWKVYRKMRDTRLPLDLRMSLAPALSRGAGRSTLPGDLRLARAYDALLNRYVAKGVLVNERREVQHVFNEAERYLRPPTGRMTTDVVELVHEDLRVAVSSAIQSALKKHERITLKGVRLRIAGEPGEIALSVVVDPIMDRAMSSTYLFVCFQEERLIAVPEPDRGQQFELSKESRAQVDQLEQELRDTKESLHATVEELETSNEELQASNEELLAANEELQSTNEELHSVNEELYSVNAEHEQKIKELVEITNDLNNLMRSTAIGTIFLDRTHCIRLFTPAAANIFNLLPQDIGRDIKHITYRVKGDDIFEVIEEVNRSQQMRERNVQAPNGRSYLRRVMPYQDEKDEAAGLVLTFVDITELLAAQRRLRLSEFSVDQAAVPTYWIAQDGHILRVNQASCEMLGYSEVDLLAKRVGDLLPSLPPTAWAEHWERIRTQKKVAMESTMRNARGSEFAVEIELNWLEFDGQEYNFAFVRDITERKQSERVLREGEERFRLLIESSPQALVMVDQGGEIKLINSEGERLFGYGRHELIGQHVETLLPERYRNLHLEQRLLYQEQPVARSMGARRELFALRKDGTELPVEIGLSPLRIGQDNYTLASLSDVSEQRRTELALKESLREKETLLKEIHHRVKNNMQLISSLLNLQSNVVPSPEAREAFRESHARIRSMALLHEKLYQSKDLARIDFAGYIRDLLAALFQSYGSKARNVTLRIDAAPALLDLNVAVPASLILNELVSNSLKHAFAERTTGAIEVRLEQTSPRRFLLLVRDDGAGLPAGFSLEGGSSLGLRLVKILVEQIGARLTFENNNGAQFELSFEQSSP